MFDDKQRRRKWLTWFQVMIDKFEGQIYFWKKITKVLLGKTQPNIVLNISDTYWKLLINHIPTVDFYFVDLVEILCWK